MGKRWGQHFLHNEQILRRLLDAARITSGEPVLEIGPGHGALTERLLAAGARVTAVEIDPLLAASLRNRWGDVENFRLIEGDVLKTGLAPQSLFGESQPGGVQPYGIIANLPYYLSTPLLFRLMQARSGFNRLLLMVQKEIAQRMAATPADGKAYGSLSIAAQHCFEIAYLFTVPPGAFSPPPKVESAVVRLIPRQPVLNSDDEAAFMEHVKMLFTGRRKMMMNTLRKQYSEGSTEALARVSARVAQRRSETLSPGEHLEVFQLLRGL